MQRERRRDPYPWTWELPTALTLAALLTALVGIQVGRSLANLVAGAGWTWPEPPSTSSDVAFTSPVSSSFWTSLPGVLAGDSRAGLGPHSAASGDLAGRGLTWASLVATEVGIVVVLGCFTLHALRRWGPGRMQGMATASEAEQLLGIARLRKVAVIVRPDLYGKHADPAPVLAPASPSSESSDRGALGDSRDPAARPGTPLSSGLSGRLSIRAGAQRRGRPREGQRDRLGDRPGVLAEQSSPWQSAERNGREQARGRPGEW